MLSNKRVIYLRFFCLIIILAWVIFIFCRSSKTSSASFAESGVVLNLIQQVFGDGVSEYAVRKLAHFTEFALLGILIEIMFGSCLQSKSLGILLSFLLSMFAAVCDESIQLFVDGRTGSLIDVWIDSAGGLTGSILGFVICMIVMLFKREDVKT